MGKKRVRSWFWRKYHKWLGITLALFLTLFALSGIVMNHRELFAPVDVPRNALPAVYRYHNWNLAVVRGTEPLGGDSVLLYGNIGIWLTQSSFRTFTDFTAGLPEGIDHRKTYTVLRSGDGSLYAATLFGLYRFEPGLQQWKPIALPGDEKEIMDLAWKGDTLVVLKRSTIVVLSNGDEASQLILPPPAGYDGKVGLFKTLWTIHSGEILGIPGILLVDAVGLIVIFLSLTGIIYFFIPLWVRQRKRKGLEVVRMVRLNRWTLRWHNKIGWTTLAFLLVTAATGMFLRPPLLIPIANARVAKIPGTFLHTPNAWHDKLRSILYDAQDDRWMVATLEGIHAFSPDLTTILPPFPAQPPVSVMGVNAFEQFGQDLFLLGSFEGLFLWKPSTGQVFDYILQQPHHPGSARGIPVGRFMVAGYTRDLNGIEVYFDYDRGSQVLGTDSRLPLMPEDIQQQPMSLWNLALEVHTARIYQVLIGNFYLLLIPLFGLGTLFILISGFIVWYRHYRKR